MSITSPITPTRVPVSRTEQRRFDVRITREPIHVYVIRSDDGGPLPITVYVATSYAEGRPAQTTVELVQDRATRLPYKPTVMAWAR